MENLINFLSAHLDSKKANFLLNSLKTNQDYFFQKFILDNINHITTWLNSDDFKQYENNTYPPLVNPKNIDIEPSDYCAELAWRLNIPLENAKFIYISPHGVGAAAFLTLLNEACNVYCPASWVLPNNGYCRYNLNFKSLLQYSQTAINISETNILDLDKYLNLIDCNIPILIQTRDPISLLKHSYGRDWSKVQRNYNQNFNLNFNYQEYINFLKPNKTYMKDDFENLLENTFIMHTLLNKINANNITYIDMCDLDEKKSYDTFINLANKFDFTPPHNDENLFKRKEFRGYIRYLLPLIFQVDYEIKLTINRYHINNEQINIFSYISNNDLKNNIGIYIDKNKISKFLNHKNYVKIKQYLSNFLDAIKDIVDYTETNLMKEDEVLDYLKKNKTARLKLKDILDKELIHIKNFRPDIVKSWKYYQEFEQFFS
ncbi:DUF2972 domain-containing protein [Campylobacter lari]|uniref:DUF2972 domain-containing protein n=1 Tax=Campylobacter lari TaxID=201 RepID=UPI002149FCD0|nr:DUF2972 domain-containing protein [Campylobacter lari]MCR2068501.1 DUF2972 domain-containing protein [Campylobacter lari subsp. concheus]